MDEVKILIENKKWNAAVNRLYYACYYAVTALLANQNLDAKTHAGVRQLFGLHFGKTGILPSDLAKFYSQIYDARQMGDYDDFLDFDEQETLLFIDPAQTLIQTIDSLIHK